MLGVPSDQSRLPDCALGLMVGIAAGEAMGLPRGSRGLHLTEHAMVVADVLLERGEVDRGELLWRWLTSPSAEDAAPPTQNDPVAPPRYRLPLVRCLPIAVAAEESGGAAREWAESAAAATHGEAESRLSAVGATLLARDLLTRSLDDSLVRLGQALREDAPETLVRSLGPGDPGDSVPEGGSEPDVLRAAIHCLVYARTFPEALEAATSRDESDDQLPALVGGLAGAIFGRSRLPVDALALLPPGLEGRLERMAAQLLRRHPRLVRAVPQQFILEPAP